MLAARLHGFGPAPDLRLETLPLAAPAPDEAQLEMLFAPVNPADLNVVEGTYGQLPDLPATLGNEGVGRVVAVGAGVTSRRIGDLVAPLDPGSWTRARNVPADRLIPLPAEIDLHQAAMITINPPSAFAMLHDFADLRPGDWVVQNAANSGVGLGVIQIARTLGLKTLNVVRRPELVDELAALGADRVVLDDTDLRAKGRELMDGCEARLALNAVGGPSALNLANALADGSPLVTYGAMGRQPLKIPNGLAIFRDLRFEGFWLRRWFREKSTDEQRAVFASLAAMLAEGSLRVPIHRVFPLREIHAALAEAARSGRDGKILVDLQAA